MRYSLKRTIEEAKRIRRNLLRARYDGRYRWRELNLAGACGLASILLSITVNDVSILRGRDGHVWTQVGKSIIDITASQFNDVYNESTNSHEACVNGVLVTREPRSYHQPVQYSGLDAYLEIINGSWYDESDHHNWRWISEYWLEMGSHGSSMEARAA